MQATPGAPLTSQDSSDGATHARRTALFLVVAAAAWAADAVTKVLAVDLLAARAPVDVVPGVVSLTLTRNPGAAFSIGTGLTLPLTLVACVVVVVVVRLAGRIRSAGWAWALGLLLGGALGNLTDRVLREPAPFRGHVVDFVRLPHWPVFNLADSCIVVAALLIAVLSLRGIGLDGTRHPGGAPPAGRQPDRETGR